MKRLSIVLAICLAAALALPAAAKTTFISIGTGGTGGVYYPYGGGLAEIWTKHVPGVKAVAEVTGASVENVKLAHKGETVIGEVMGDVAYQAYYGKGKFKGKKQNILSMGMMYPNLFQVVTLKGSGIKVPSDMKGKIVSIGSPGSGTAFMSNLVFDALGMKPRGTFKVRRLSFNENTMALRDKTIQVGVWCVAPGTSSIKDLSTTHDIHILPFSKKEQDTVTKKYTFYAPFEVPAGTYRGQDKAVPTISVWNVIICKADLDTELVYKLVKVLYAQNDYMQKIHPFARYTTPENAIKTSPIPFHPGLVKYLKEKGLKIPARLMPPG